MSISKRKNKDENKDENTLKDENLGQLSFFERFSPERYKNYIVIAFTSFMIGSIHAKIQWIDNIDDSFVIENKDVSFDRSFFTESGKYMFIKNYDSESKKFFYKISNTNLGVKSTTPVEIYCPWNFDGHYSNVEEKWTFKNIVWRDGLNPEMKKLIGGTKPYNHESIPYKQLNEAGKKRVNDCIGEIIK